MNLQQIVKWSFLVSLVFGVIGACLKIMHKSGADIFLMIGLVATLIFMVSAITEVFSSRRIAHSEKIMWTIGFIFFSGIAGLVYFLLGRRRIAESV
jgi:Phospholipase_D-nuclease N-terminal